jgi:nitrate reductase (cytochrome), electron transfer subunit
MKTSVVPSLLAVLIVGCVTANTPPLATSDPPAPISEGALGLAKGSVFDVPTPPAVKANDSGPGELPVLPRAYVIAPPRIPHGIGDFVPITQKQNACLDCHGVKEKNKGEPTPIPASHYTDYRNDPERVGSQVSGARYICVSCHAVRTDAPNLVGNTFRP